MALVTRLLFLFPIFVALMGPPASAMSYALVRLDDGRCSERCPEAIYAAGTIELDEPRRLLAFAQSLAARGSIPANLILHSPGGNLAGALALGQGVRQLGMRTIVAGVAATVDGGGGLTPGRCASACVFVLMAGRSRVIPEGSRVLVHSPRRAGGGQRDIVGSGTGTIDRITPTEAVTETLEDYTRAMGVDPALVALSYTVPHDSIRALTTAEIARFRLATMNREPGMRSPRRVADQRRTRGRRAAID